MKRTNYTSCLVALVVTTLIAAPSLRAAEDSLSWKKDKNSVSADISGAQLQPTLERVAKATGWEVYVEPSLSHSVTAKFKDLPPGDALRHLLGDLNFAVIPQTNAPSRLYVFHTTIKSATQRIEVAESDASKSKIIKNELIVKLKPGAKIDDIAKSLGAKVVGKIDSMGAYRLQFEDAAAADAAREQLASNSDVASVDNNYSVDRPTVPRQAPGAPLPPPSLQLKPPADSGKIIVGLVDTAVQPLGGNLDSFLLKQVSVAGDASLDPNAPDHGTSMAETMMRSLQAITKGSTSVQILPVDVYGPNTSTTTFDVANGIVAAVNGGAKIVNLSLGSYGDSTFLHNVITDVSKNNIAIFAAAGNQPVTTPFYPAAYPEVTAVTAVSQGQIADYASRGSFISLGAPGTSIVYYNNQPYYVTGTSASSAFISGMAAGYLDTTHNSLSQMSTFLNSNFGMKTTTGK
jgi:hypothetical protein